MKNISKLSVLVLMVAFASCKDAKIENGAETTTMESNESHAEGQLYSCPMHPEVTGKQGEECSKCGMELTEPVTNSEVVEEVTEMDVTKSKAAFSIDMILNDYLKLKNALASDDGALATASSKALETTLQKTTSDKIEADLITQYNTIVNAAKQHTAAITENAGKIAAQRNAFALLSTDMHNFIKMFNTDKKLYQDYCPMYNQGKNGYWISEIKDIKNPYYGAEMLTCGGITKEF
ncbi:DUF3347 domain-containing protein [Flavobacterium frigoris]|uniref:Uncharacterized protein n=1 Tax=Flavobacterium frigoris TaxID=229204 RepID=A0A1H9G0A4_FLAFI|nr:DUF3347 domain-containing protein [Flavobacterium frigoris]SEQ43343.1 Protein of unknown function [Flavobacterium frigoris]